MAHRGAPRATPVGPVILIADDDDGEARTTLQRRLVHDGYVVVTANTGDAAILLARGMRPALLISELYLACADGPCLVHAVRRDAEFRGLPIIAYTAFAFPVDRAWAADARVDMFVRKPGALAELRSAVERLAGPPYRARHA